MLRGIRKATSNWVGKAIMGTVMGVLILSFAVWGVADIFKGFGQSTVAKIGRTEITIDQFRTLYNDRLQQVGRQLGRPLSSDQARAFGFDRQVLQQAIAEATLDEAARRAGLAQSDAEVVRSIQNDPNFAGINGKFDPTRFNQIIRQFGFTEARYIAEQRRVSLRRQLAGTVSGGVEPSKAQLEAALRYREESRTVDYIKLGVAQAGDIEQPSPEALAAYFEERKALFRAPEYRKVAIVGLTPGERAATIQVSDEDGRRMFEANRGRYGSPERRQVLQMVFPTLEDATAAREKLTGGLSFEDLAKERGLAPADYDLGLVQKSGVIDPASADAAFALPLNEVSAPVQGRFGTILTKVTKIEPGNSPPYEMLATTVKRDLAIERARGLVQDIHNKMEDERGLGTPVMEAAAKLDLPVTTIEAVDRSGRAPDGQPAALPPGVDLVSAIFSSDVGADADPLPLPQNSGYVWFDVQGVTPSRERTLEEVKDQVATRWRDDQIAARLQAKTKEMMDKIAAGAKLADLTGIAGADAKVETASGIKRNVTNPAVGSNVSDGAFRLAKGASDQAAGALPTERIVYTLTEIVEPTFNADSAEAKTARETLQRNLADEQVGQFVAKLETEIGTSINQTAFAQATGAASQTQP